MAIYERPTKILMREFARERLKPGQIFDKSEAVRWFNVRLFEYELSFKLRRVEG